MLIIWCSIYLKIRFSFFPEDNFEPKSEIRVKKDKDILSSPSSPKPMVIGRDFSQSPDINVPGRHPTG